LLAWGLDHAVAHSDPDRHRYHWAIAEQRAGRTP
jgi:hypothetical protein